MSQKRTLPERSNRGRRPKTTPQEEAVDDQIYQHFFGRVEQTQVVDRNEQGNQIRQERENPIDYKFNMSLNRPKYPYSRGYHYFFDLDKFPRVFGHPSYALDENNAFNYTYSQEDKVIKGSTIHDLINRKFVHIAEATHVRNSSGHREGDKNMCHSHLFSTEDKKYFIDRSLLELKHIHRNLKELVETNKIFSFGCLKRDYDLISLIEDDLTQQEKKLILEKKIKVLEERKKNTEIYFQNEDRMYFYHSLNQKLHNKIEILEEKLNLQRILLDLFTSDNVRTALAQQLSDEDFPKNKLKQLFTYHQSTACCLSQDKLNYLSPQITDQFFTVDNNQLHNIIIPVKYISFANPKLMLMAEKLLVYRLVSQSQSIFYIGKLFWKNIFNRNLQISKEIKQTSRQEFDKVFYNGLHLLSKYPENQLFTFDFPTLDEFVDEKALKQDTTIHKPYLFTSSNSIKINPREYACIMLFYHIYHSLSHLFSFLADNQFFIEVMGSESFARVHHAVVEMTGKAEVGILQSSVKKLAEFIQRSDIDLNFDIFWKFVPDKGVGYVWKQQRSEWETEKEDEQKQEQDDEDIPQKKRLPQII